MFRSLAKSAVARQRLPDAAALRFVSAAAQNKADHILQLSSPLSPSEPSLLLQQTQLLREFQEPVTPDDLALAIRVFDKIATIGSTVDKFSCARLSLMCVNAGAPEKGLEPWTRLLEQLSTLTSTNTNALKRVLAKADFEPAAMAALAAYFLVAGPSADLEVAQKLVPRMPIPTGLHVLRNVGEIKSEEAQQAVMLGLARLREHTTASFTSKEFLDEVSTAPFAKVIQLWEQIMLVLKPKEISEKTYATFIRRYAETRQTKRAFALWQQLAQSGAPVSCSGWAALLKTALHAPENSEELFDGLWDKMLAQGFQPNAECYTERLLRLTRRQELKMAEQLLNELQAKHVKKELLLEPRAVNVMVSAYARVQNFEKVDALVQWAAKNQLPLTTFTFNPVLQATRGQPELSSKYLRMLTEHGLQPDIVTYTFAVDQQMKRRLPVAELLAEMRVAKIAFTPQFQTMLAYNIGQSSKNVEVARELMSALLREKVPVSMVTLGAFIELELKYGDVQRAVQYLELIPRFGLAPSVPTHNQIVKGALRRRNFGVAKWALRALLEGSHYRLVPNVHTFMAVLTPWSTRDLQNDREVRQLLQTTLPELEKRTDLLDYALIKQLERVIELAPELVPESLRTVTRERGVELFDKRRAP